ncbi:unnamed protein product [Cuscuta epithymum]|uniref:Uncharacterized protein n=1 Tax=Cuscuta epithymum TaxID=186058 RepID=A0AAV0CJ30_9ASTE|nr:unnamed protein product [Cuscuta epithymum]
MAPKRKQNDGASSSSYSHPRFTSHENEEWYETRKKWGMVVEKTVDPIIDATFELTEAFMELGWAVMLTLTGAYYPQLVREFYANITDKQTGYAVIHSFVKGKNIKIDPSFLSRLLKVPDDGTTLEFTLKGISSDKTYDEVRTMESFR